jgi:hypothetical protein
MAEGDNDFDKIDKEVFKLKEELYTNVHTMQRMFKPVLQF